LIWSKTFSLSPHWNAEFPDSVNPILLQGFSLNYEMFFYALFAAAMLAGRWRNFILLSVLICLPAVRFLGDGAAVTFYSNDLVLEFGLGVALYYAPRPEWSRWVWLFIVAAGFAALFICFDYRPKSIAQGLPALIIVWASIGACKGWLKLYPIALIGAASYAIYLFHWTSFGLAKPLGQNLNPPLLCAALVAIALLSGILVHLMIEKPLTRFLQNLPRRHVRPQPT
jgi:exopolysaccharide production protein ExoZ